MVASASPTGGPPSGTEHPDSRPPIKRRFRRLYNAVCGNSGAVEPFSLDPSRFAAEESVSKALMRPAVWPVYGMLLAIIAAVTLRYWLR